jgi:uncharacterized protein (DUF1015 family)
MMILKQIIDYCVNATHIFLVYHNDDDTSFEISNICSSNKNKNTYEGNTESS